LSACCTSHTQDAITVSNRCATLLTLVFSFNSYETPNTYQESILKCLDISEEFLQTILLLIKSIELRKICI
jgi:hypothetical protein